MNKEFKLENEYSLKADELRKNRIEMSFYKYGSAKINYGERLVNAKNSAKMCIEKYEKTNNTEYLLDAMNYLMFEFMYPPKDAYFKATDSSESAGKDGISYNESLSKL